VSRMTALTRAQGIRGAREGPTGFTLNPVLPRDWPELTITRIRYQDAVMSDRAGNDSFDIFVVDSTGLPGEPLLVSVGASLWRPGRRCRNETYGRFLFRGVRTPPRGIRLRTEQPCKLMLPDSNNPRLGIRGLCWDRAFPSS